jgi:transcriptional regulator with XRE-family HTH domain
MSLVSTFSPTRHTDMPLPQWLKTLRHHVEQSQQQFADVLGVHRTTLARYEIGTRYPGRDVRLRLNEIARDAGFAPIPPKLRRRP